MGTNLCDFVKLSKVERARLGVDKHVESNRGEIAHGNLVRTGVRNDDVTGHLVYSTISVQRLEHLIVPKFC